MLKMNSLLWTVSTVILQVGAVNAQCSAAFRVEAGRCIFVNPNQSFSWCDANRLCASMGGELINSYGSLQLLGSMPSLNCSCTIWLGVSDLSDERNTSRRGWLRIHDRGLMPFDDSLWCSSDPNNLDNKQDCISHCSSSYGRLADLQCSTPRGFACEFDGAAPSQPLAIATWRRTPFKRTSYNPSSEYCYTDLPQVENAMHCVAAAMRAGGSSGHALYNSRLRVCRLLQFTDAQVEAEIENSPDWVKFSLF